MAVRLASGRCKATVFHGVSAFMVSNWSRMELFSWQRSSLVWSRHDRIRVDTPVDVAVPGAQGVNTRGTSCALAGVKFLAQAFYRWPYVAMGTYYRQTDVES